MINKIKNFFRDVDKQALKIVMFFWIFLIAIVGIIIALVVSDLARWIVFGIVVIAVFISVSRIIYAQNKTPRKPTKKKIP
jgi:bacteriorhodopsin